MRYVLWTCLLLAFPAAAQAPVAAQEIERLIAAMGSSHCEFQRNGSWYPSKKAEDHLRRKYDYLRERGKVSNAEQFIALAGTRSSTSGRVYRVRCPGKPAVDSAIWLRTRLLEMRRPIPTPGEPR